MLTWQQETLTFAASRNAEQQGYRGLQAGQIGNVTPESESVLVKPEVAARQMAEDQSKIRTINTSVADQPNAHTGEESSMGHVSTAGTTTPEPVSRSDTLFRLTCA